MSERTKSFFLSPLASPDCQQTHNQNGVDLLFSPPETLHDNTDDEYEDCEDDIAYHESQDSLSSLNAIMAKWTLASPPPQRKAQIPPCISEDDEEQGYVSPAGTLFTATGKLANTMAAKTQSGTDEKNSNSSLSTTLTKQKKDEMEIKWDKLESQLNQIKSLLDLLILPAKNTVARQENEALATNRKLNQLEEKLDRIESALATVVALDKECHVCKRSSEEAAEHAFAPLLVKDNMYSHAAVVVGVTRRDHILSSTSNNNKGDTLRVEFPQTAEVASQLALTNTAMASTSSLSDVLPISVPKNSSSIFEDNPMMSADDCALISTIHARSSQPDGRLLEATTGPISTMKVLGLPALWRLKKMRKPQLFALCKKHGFDTSNLETKTDLLVRLQQEAETTDTY